MSCSVKFLWAVASRRDLCSVCIPLDRGCGTERSLWGNLCHMWCHEPWRLQVKGGSVAGFHGNWWAPAAHWRSSGSVLVCAQGIQWWTYVAVPEKPWQKVCLMEGKLFSPFLQDIFTSVVFSSAHQFIWLIFGNIGDNFYCLKHDFLLCYGLHWICRPAQIYILFRCCLRFCFGSLLLAGRKKTYQPMNC